MGTGCTNPRGAATSYVEMQVPSLHSICDTRNKISTLRQTNIFWLLVGTDGASLLRRNIPQWLMSNCVSLYLPSCFCCGTGGRVLIFDPCQVGCQWQYNWTLYPGLPWGSQFAASSVGSGVASPNNKSSETINVTTKKRLEDSVKTIENK
jgi:hypothetical protein